MEFDIVKNVFNLGGRRRTEIWVFYNGRKAYCLKVSDCQYGLVVKSCGVTEMVSHLNTGQYAPVMDIKRIKIVQRHGRDHEGT